MPTCLASGLLLAALVLGAQAPAEPPVPLTVRAVADLVEREYFDAAKAAAVAADLRRRLAEGRYAPGTPPAELAARLTDDLRAATGDRHLLVSVAPPEAPAGTPSPRESREERGRRENYGVVRAEILPGNVGLLRVDAFYRLSEARAAVDAAMALLVRADALVLDLRANGGGAPDTVAYLASAFVVPSAAPLFEVVPRHGETSAYPVVRPLPFEADAGRPVYVLTAAGTFSAGEGLAFILQARRRAEVIGERTAGAANPGRPYPAGHGFEVVVPNGAVRVPGVAGNWEGAGVVPDVACPAADALRTAHGRALARLADAAPEGAWREALRRIRPVS